MASTAATNLSILPSRTIIEAFNIGPRPVVEACGMNYSSAHTINIFTSPLPKRHSQVTCFYNHTTRYTPLVQLTWTWTSSWARSKSSFKASTSLRYSCTALTWSFRELTSFPELMSQHSHEKKVEPLSPFKYLSPFIICVTALIAICSSSSIYTNEKKRQLTRKIKRTPTYHCNGLLYHSHIFDSTTDVLQSVQKKSMFKGCRCHCHLNKC